MRDDWRAMIGDHDDLKAVIELAVSNARAASVLAFGRRRGQVRAGGYGCDIGETQGNDAAEGRTGRPSARNDSKREAA